MTEIRSKCSPLGRRSELCFLPFVVDIAFFRTALQLNCNKHSRSTGTAVVHAQRCQASAATTLVSSLLHPRNNHVAADRLATVYLSLVTDQKWDHAIDRSRSDRDVPHAIPSRHISGTVLF